MNSVQLGRIRRNFNQIKKEYEKSIEYENSGKCTDTMQERLDREFFLGQLKGIIDTLGMIDMYDEYYEFERQIDRIIKKTK